MQVWDLFCYFLNMSVTLFHQEKLNPDQHDSVTGYFPICYTDGFTWQECGATQLSVADVLKVNFKTVISVLAYGIYKRKKAMNDGCGHAIFLEIPSTLLLALFFCDSFFEW